MFFSIFFFLFRVFRGLSKMSKSKKSKERKKAKLLKRRKTSQPTRLNEQQAMRKLSEKTAKITGMEDLKFVANPEGEVKMSEVLEEFVEPYYLDDMTYEEAHKLFTIGVIAWNMSFFDEADREKEVRKFAGGFHDMTDGILSIIGPMIDRKVQYFGQYDRIILNFQLTDTGETFHLSVASSLPQKGR
jgi:hypothetical protein